MTSSRRGSPSCGGGSRAVTHAELLDRFRQAGFTIAQLAEALPAREHTVHSWKRRDSIPSEYWRDIERVARELGVHGVSVSALRRIADQRGEERRALRGAARSSGPVPSRISFP